MFADLLHLSGDYNARCSLLKFVGQLERKAPKLEVQVMSTRCVVCDVAVKGVSSYCPLYAHPALLCLLLLEVCVCAPSDCGVCLVSDVAMVGTRIT